MSLKIGIPRALSYYVYFPFWKAFFEEIGAEVVTSGITTKGVLDKGVKEAVTDACVPVKLFHGHVLDLPKDVDYIFIPRLVTISKEDSVTFCPKFLGLPDLVRSSMQDIPPLLDVKVDLKKGPMELFRICNHVGKQLDKGFWTNYRAYLKAQQSHRKYESLLKKYTPIEAMEIMDGKNPPAEDATDSNLTLAVVGFPYAVYDSFVSVDIIKKLKSLGVKVKTVEMVSPKDLLRQAKKLPKNLFWNFSNKIIRGALYYFDESKIDGIIHVTAFACGPDSMVDRLIELEAKDRDHVPFMSVTIDEHTGEAGMVTRLEAFVDMLRFRRDVS